MVYKYQVTVNGEKFDVEGSSQLSAISRACRMFIKDKANLFDEKLTLEVVSEKVGGSEEPKTEEKEEEVDLEEAQKKIDESTVVLQEPKDDEPEVK